MKTKKSFFQKGGYGFGIYKHDFNGIRISNNFRNKFP